MKKTKVIFSLMIITLSGCATLFSDRADIITLKTEPSGAEVYLGTELLGTTPLEHSFKRSTLKTKALRIRKKGYKPKKVILRKTIAVPAFFNFGFFFTTMGATSWGIDALTGAMSEYDPKSYFVDLEPNELDSGYKKRRNRRFFALMNYDLLMRDISRGDGGYLSAYYDVLKAPVGYNVFLENIDLHRDKLLSQKDGVELYQYFETHLN